MARRAALVLGAPLALLTAGALFGALGDIGARNAQVWALGGGGVFALAFALGSLSVHEVELATGSGEPFEPRFAALFVEGPGGAPPAWLGSWAWELPAGRFGATWRRLAMVGALALCLCVAIGASITQHLAAPATLAGAIGGLLAFMFSLRCHPLSSPTLRASPIRFSSLCLRLLRLPLILSSLVFVAPASAAVIAQPSAWTMPLSGAAGLLLLNSAYSIFGVYFMTAPKLAAFGFVSAVLYFAYRVLRIWSARDLRLCGGSRLSLAARGAQASPWLKRLRGRSRSG